MYTSIYMYIDIDIDIVAVGVLATLLHEQYSLLAKVMYIHTYIYIYTQIQIDRQIATQIDIDRWIDKDIHIHRRRGRAGDTPARAVRSARKGTVTVYYVFTCEYIHIYIYISIYVCIQMQIYRYIDIQIYIGVVGVLATPPREQYALLAKVAHV